METFSPSNKVDDYDTSLLGHKSLVRKKKAPYYNSIFECNFQSHNQKKAKHQNSGFFISMLYSVKMTGRRNGIDHLQFLDKIPVHA